MSTKASTNSHGVNDDGVRKAAILVSALDRDSVDQLLEEIGPAQAGLIRQAVIDLENIDSNEQDRVVEEFFTLANRRGGDRLTDSNGVELDADLSHCIGQTAGRSTHSGVECQQASAAPFGFLEETQIEDLVAILAAERPQTIALVLSRMAPSRAGEVLVQFSPDMQTEIVRRLVDLEETDADILREVEIELQRRLSQKLHVERRRVAGAPAVAGIIEACDTKTKDAILHNIIARDKRLAQRVVVDRLGDDKAAVAPDLANEQLTDVTETVNIAFSDIIHIGDDALKVILESVARDILVLALFAAPGRLVERILRQLPRRQAADVRRRIENIGPVRLADVEEARRQLLEAVGRLHGEGRISLNTDSGNSSLGLTA